MPMTLTPRTAPTIQGEHSYGSVEKTVSTGSKLKLQTTGTDAAVMFFQGPPPDKKWLVTLNVFVKEVDI